MEDQEPAPHDTQELIEVDAIVEDQAPITQLLHAASSDTPRAEDHVPTGQGTHCATSVAPLVSDQYPISQLIQVLGDTAAVVDDQVPALQDTHTPPDDQAPIMQLEQADWLFAPTAVDPIPFSQ